MEQTEVEQSLIGAALLDVHATLAGVEGTGLQADHFAIQRHRELWRVIVSMAGRRQAVDVITVFEALRDAGRADGCGGLVYLNELAQSVPSVRNAGRYAELVRERALRRSIATAAKEAQALADDTAIPTSELTEKIGAMFSRLAQESTTGAPRAALELVSERLEYLDSLAQGKTLAGLSTGLSRIDAALGGGLKGGKLIVLAARPSVGKTSLAGQIALAVAGAGAPVLVLSQEMPAGELVDRCFSNLGRVNMGALATGRMSDEDFSRLSDGAERLSRLPLHIDDTPGLKLADVRHKARMIRQRCGGLALVVVDYLQLMTGSNPRDNRNAQVEEISRGLKTLAKELDCCVLALSQLNRRATDRSEPDLSDLRDSGAVEQDADTVMMLSPVEELEGGRVLVACILAKNRQGRRGRLALEFTGAVQRWDESDADVRPGARKHQNEAGQHRRR
ncbi:DNA helicase [Vitreoscilla filiformis]|uniref:DNA 5'-3' helicase n=1 Tax=Vitreoscilla filiformis TaxID=63 RepID=A0A221KI03_VITFI|nr:replicative DNA helicase [Vitreoscilla filiformis]ASM78684.1 DNA helicase [Vitreoscilla filiformis]